MNFWKTADQFPPVLVRLLARHPKGKPLTVAEIVARSCLDAWQVESISRLTSWRGVDLPTMRAFLDGCGIDFCDGATMHKVREYLRVRRNGQRPNFKYLRTSPDYQTIYYPLYQLYIESITKNH